MYYNIRNYRTNIPLHLQNTYTDMESKHSIPDIKEGVVGETLVSLQGFPTKLKCIFLFFLCIT